MPDPTQQDLSRHFSNLVGRKVTFEKTLVNSLSKDKKAFAVYKSFPTESLIVVAADLRFLGSLAGALVGLPDSEVQNRLAKPVLDDLLNDAISEILNVTSAAIATEERAVFTQMVLERSGVKDAADAILTKPHRQISFNVTVENYQGGKFQVFS